MQDDKLGEMVATLAVHCQRAEDRLESAEDLFKSSVIIPSAQLVPVLIAVVLIMFFFCATLGFIWYLDRPI